jgi:hypothetical protein
MRDRGQPTIAARCRLLAGLCAAWLCLIRPAAAAAAPLAAGDLAVNQTQNCYGEIPGTVYFEGLQVFPEHPVVGEDVDLRFSVSFAVYTVRSLSLLGAAPQFAGETSKYYSSDTLFQMTAAQAGRATLQLAVTYGTELLCDDGEGHTYYAVGPDRTTTSPAYVVEVAEAPTPTPTLTATPTPTEIRTPAGEPSDEGCSILRTPRGSAGWPILLPLLGFLFKRRSTLTAVRRGTRTRPGRWEATSGHQMSCSTERRADVKIADSGRDRVPPMNVRW